MKKLISALLASMLVFSLAACRGGDAASTPESASGGAESTASGVASTSAGADESTTAEPSGNYKIGIMTGTVSQGEEEYQAAQNMVEKYGADKIVTATYPDKFNDEIETTISQVVNLASDPDVKAIIICQAVPGTIAAIEKTRETRPDMLFIAGVAQENPRDVSKAADVVLQVDEIGMGTAVIEQADKMGAKTFVHYSFPRHLGVETIAARTELFKKTCEEKGIKYVEATAPDPTGDAGVSGAQQFIVEDVPRKVKEFGKDTAFFSTNCSMQEPLIRTVMEQGAIFPQQCCPSPYHGYPAAMNIDTKGHEGDVQYMLDQITEKVKAGGNEGRMSTWPVPINMLIVEASTEYAIQFAEGKLSGAFDDAGVKEAIKTVATEYNTTANVSLYSDAEGEIPNYYMILADFYNF